MIALRHLLRSHMRLKVSLVRCGDFCLGPSHGYASDKQFITNICKNIFNKTEQTFVQKEEIFEDTEEGVDLYKGTFSDIPFNSLFPIGLRKVIYIHLKHHTLHQK